jgi:hypothetical protein
MKRKWIFAILATAAFVIACLEPASGRQKQLRWEVVIGSDSTDDQPQVLYMPTEVIAENKGTIYVLQKESIEQFDGRGRHMISITLKKGKGPGEYAGPASLAQDKQGSLYVWDQYLTRVSKLDESGRFMNSMKVGSMFKKMALLGKGELVFLGLSEDHIMHVYSADGKKLRSFGDPFDPVPDVPVFATSPIEWFVHGDTIWVANPLSYEIRQYVGEKLVSTIKGPDRFPAPRISGSGGSLGVGISKRISGLAECNRRLVATVMQPTNVATLDVFDITNGTLLSRIGCLPIVRSSDSNGRLFFVDEGKVKVGRIE